MQTFLPYPSFEKSAKVLDNKRLGKQRVEALQILKALLGYYDNTGAWKNHPATLMWKGHELYLTSYIEAICEEWINRGFKDSVLQRLEEIMDKYCLFNDQYEKDIEWMGNEEFHSSHRAALLKKDYDHYKQFNWKEKPKIEYVWPVRRGGVVE